MEEATWGPEAVRHFLWLVVFLKVLCLRPEKPAGGLWRGPQKSRRGCPEDSTVPAEDRGNKPLAGPGPNPEIVKRGNGHEKGKKSEPYEAEVLRDSLSQGTDMLGLVPVR